MNVLFIAKVLVSVIPGLFEPLQSQGTEASAQELLRSSRELTAGEVARVRDAAVAVWNGKTFRVSGLQNTGGPEFQILMGAHGRPRYARHELDDMVDFEDYTRRPAVSCDGGKRLGEELVIEYAILDRGAPWIAKARGSSTPSFPEYYEMLEGRLEGAPIQEIGGRNARALVGPGRLFSYSTRTVPADEKQYLWLDVETLLPLRWEIMNGGVPTQWGLSFAYDRSLQLKPPLGIRAPTCVSDR